MGKTFGDDHALRRPLEYVVSDLVRGPHSFLHITRLKPFAIVGGPDSGVAICLQLHCDLKAVALYATSGLLRCLHFFRNARQLLDMMANFVRDHIGLGKIARCPEALRQFLKKR